MNAVGRIVDYDIDRRIAIIEAPISIQEYTQKRYEEVEIILHDGRSISPSQRAKARALVGDIALWAGYDIRYEADNLHQLLKAGYCASTGTDDFSLSDCDTSTAREYINFLINFVLANDIPCLDSILNRTDDINATLFACLYNRKCCICGKTADIHHTEAIGMGRDRKEIVHEGMLVMALCRMHHEKAHSMGQKSFDNEFHVYGIKLTKILTERWKMGKKG